MSPLEKGFNFVRDNPQLLYTVFLAVMIPLAFLYTSNQFLAISREKADAAERTRNGIFQDVVLSYMKGGEIFAPATVASALTSSTSTTEIAMTVANPEVSKFESHLNDVLKVNPTVNDVWVLTEVHTATGTEYAIVASTDHNSLPLASLTPDATFAYMLNVTKGATGDSYSFETTHGGTRMWRLVRTVEDPYPGIRRAYLFTDVTMAAVDQRINDETLKAYGILAIVAIGIMLLLARQARVTDYATLYAKLAEVDKMKDDFVSMAAHELRSPLTTIRGYVDLIRDVQPMNEKATDMLVRIEHSANDLNNLIGDILDVARLQEGRMSFNLESLNPESVILDVVDSFRKPAADKGLTLTYIHTTESGPLPNIIADTTRLRQVMVNFIGNAVKYTPAGKVDVITKIAGTDAKFVEIRISDTGLGISAEAQKRLFEKFYRVKTSATSKIVGTGLGLWITKEIVEKMGGNISIESIEGKGSDFIVKFPIAKTTV